MERISAFRKRVEDSIAGKIRSRPRVVMLSISLALVLISELAALNHYRSKSGDFPLGLNIDFALGAATVLMALLFSKGPGKTYFTDLLLWQSNVCLVVWLIGRKGYYLPLWATVTSVFILMWIAFLWLRKKGIHTRLLGSLGISLLVYWAICFQASGWHDASRLFLLRPHRILLFFLPLLVSAREWTPGSTAAAFRYLLFPINIRYSVPTDLAGISPEADPGPTRVRGSIDVLIASTFLACVFFMTFKHFEPLGALSFGEFLYSGFFSYIETYFLSCGLVSLYVGCGRIAGFKLQDPFLTPLLASSPFERWRRWNTPLLDFYRWFVYLPLMRWSRSLFIAVMTTFVVTFLFHAPVNGPLNFFRIHHFVNASNFAAFFMAHGLLVYVSLKWPLKIYRGETRSGWWGVLVTWLVMIPVHSLIRWRVV